MEEMLGGVRITYLGHATFRLTTPGDEQIIVDPWIQENPTVPEELKNIGELDTMLITHGHFDHFADAVSLAQQTGARTVSAFEIYAYLQGKGIEAAEPIQKGGTGQVGGIKVTATNAFHSSSIQADDGTLMYGGEPMGYVIEFESGFKLYHAGDTDLFGDMQLIGELHRPDIAILPIGDRLTMGPREAAHAARLLGVRHVIPIHYDTNVIPVFTGTPAEFRKQLDAIAPGVTMHDLNPGDHLSS